MTNKVPTRTVADRAAGLDKMGPSVKMGPYGTASPPWGLLSRLDSGRSWASGSVPIGGQAEPQGRQHLEHCCELRISVAPQRAIQAFASEAGFLRNMAHAPHFCQVTKSVDCSSRISGGQCCVQRSGQRIFRQIRRWRFRLL